MLEIPGLSQLSRFLASPAVVSNVQIIDIVLGVILYFAVDQAKYFPSGMTYFYMMDKFKKHFKTISPKLGVFLMHCPAPLIFTYNIFFFPNGDPFSPAAISFAVITYYRAFIYPFFRNKYATRIPIRTVLLYSFISANLGYNASIALIFTPASWGLAGRYVIAGIVAILFILNVVHDWIICRERTENRNVDTQEVKKSTTGKPNKKSAPGGNKQKKPTTIKVGGYRIDHCNTLGWKKVTCPQYALTFFMWCAWSFNLGSAAAALSYLVLLAYLTISKADGIHAVTCMTCGPYHLLGRKPIFPFMTDSKIFYRIISRF